MTFSINPLLFLIICILTFSCGTDNSSNDNKNPSDNEVCKYGTPTPIFSNDLGKVTKHAFNAKGQKGVERVKFENGVDLELLQSGCNELMQSYRFALKADLEGNDQFWVEQAVEQFRYLSTLSENHLSFSLWAGAIQNSAEFISLGETFEPEPSTFIKIDKIPSGEKTLLVVTFEAKG